MNEAIINESKLINELKTVFMKSYKEKYNKGLVYVVENNFEIHPIRELPSYIN